MKEIDRYADNLRELDKAFTEAGGESLLHLTEMPLGEFLKECAVRGVDISAKCLRPAGEQK